MFKFLIKLLATCVVIFLIIFALKSFVFTENYTQKSYNYINDNYTNSSNVMQTANQINSLSNSLLDEESFKQFNNLSLVINTNLQIITTLNPYIKDLKKSSKGITKEIYNSSKDLNSQADELKSYLNDIEKSSNTESKKLQLLALKSKIIDYARMSQSLSNDVISYLQDKYFFNNYNYVIASFDMINTYNSLYLENNFDNKFIIYQNVVLEILNETNNISSSESCINSILNDVNYCKALNILKTTNFKTIAKMQSTIDPNLDITISSSVSTKEKFNSIIKVVINYKSTLRN